MQNLKLMNINDVAGCLGVSRSTVKRLIISGEITPIRVSEKLVRFTPENISDYINRASAAAGLQTK
jgi:excisionase family DNA binding protein